MSACFLENFSFVEWSKKSFEEKLMLSEEMVFYALKNSRNPVVSFSGGKNSLVVLHLVLQFDKNVKVLFANTTNEFPETVKYVHWLAKEWKLNFYEVRPEMTWIQVINKYGFPHQDRYKHREPKCCYILKTKPCGKWIEENGIDLAFTGITGWESYTRRLSIYKMGCYYSTRYVGGYRLKHRIWKCNPICFWRNEDVLRYIRLNNLPVNPAYEKYGLDRLGCMYCTGYIGWEKKIARINPRMYEWIMKKMGQNLLF